MNGRSLEMPIQQERKSVKNRSECQAIKAFYTMLFLVCTPPTSENPPHKIRLHFTVLELLYSTLLLSSQVL